jgi:hypothetical protein
VQSLAFAWLARMVLGFPYRDPQAGLKGMHAAVAQFLLPRLACNGFAFDCEVLTACARLAIPVEEVPVRVRFDDRRTTTSVRTSLRTVRDLLAIGRAWRQAPDAVAAPVGRDKSAAAADPVLAESTGRAA